MSVTRYKDPITGEWIKQSGNGTGADGKNAYEIAQEKGFEGTEVEWLASLKGADGEKGAPGTDGKSAYAYALDGGYTGTEEDFADKLAQNLPTALKNPNPLIINGQSYDGSKPVDINISGGSVSGNRLLGQTPFAVTSDATIKLVGSGEHTYRIQGKTFADLSSATVTYKNATLTQNEDYIEIADTGAPNWYDCYATLAFSGLTVGAKYIFAIKGMGIDTANLINNGYYLIKNASGAELGRISQDAAALHSVEFTADTSSINVQCYPANNYYWNTSGHRKARIGDIYINEAANGTERTDVINKSGTFTDSYALGQVSKGVTITADPTCEVYSVSGGSGEGTAALPLAGKTVVCFGDSLFGMYTGDTSAPAYVAKRTGATVYNVGFSGCRMSQHPYSSHNPFCMYALATAIASGDWSLQDANAASGSANFPDQLAILKGIDFAEVDAIVTHYGTNDFSAGGGGVKIDNADNPKDTATVCGALRYSIETLLNAYPELQIFVSVPAFRTDMTANSSGVKLTDYVDAIANTAKEYNLPVIDSYYGLGINQINAPTFLADGVHHNIAGRKRLGYYIGSCMIASF